MGGRLPGVNQLVQLFGVGGGFHLLAQAGVGEQLGDFAVEAADLLPPPRLVRLDEEDRQR